MTPRRLSTVTQHLSEIFVCSAFYRHGPQRGYTFSPETSTFICGIELAETWTSERRIIYIWHYYLDLPWWHNWYVIYWSENVLKGNHAIKLMASLIYLLCTCTDVDKCEKFQVTLEILKVLVEKKGNVTPYPHITSYHYPYINFIYDEAKKLPVALLWLSLKMVNLKNILKGTIVCQASTPVFK